MGPAEEAHLVLGTNRRAVPLVAERDSWGRTCISGPLKVLSLPKHYDFSELRKTPNEVREMLRAVGRAMSLRFKHGMRFIAPIKSLPGLQQKSAVLC